MRRLTACFSMYSLMSMRTMARSSSNRKSASDRASSVLPTPVGPRNRNEPLVEDLLHADELGHLALHEAADRHAGPPGHHLGDVLLVDLLLQHGLAGLQLVELPGGLLDLPLEVGDHAVADLGGPAQVALALEV